jgi:hypothetical protein
MRKGPGSVYNKWNISVVICDTDIPFSFICMFCRLLFVLLYFFLWPLCCLFFFDIRFLIAPLVSSSSCEKKKYSYVMQYLRPPFWKVHYTPHVIRHTCKTDQVITPPGDMTSSVFSGVRVTQSLVLYVCFADRCLSFCSFSPNLYL